ncbi:Predicted N-acyltransferase, GNAT family [Xylanibacter ruminicola]|uniref:Predicted N-acyltransferase, GNAT family n=1 Tax=Xylanibacter ruminicola TaxID=839 RepID=A0A1H4DPW9_XYLRU|nr:GNAT family N-acetyltransferase [Xylanibacter ruminicola]SEA74559.1 Predicted N-acyltransferase, GNAT family [Xylanibacter ruminicola]
MKQVEAELHKKTFQELTTDELYELLRVRSEVFVVEQNCVYQDLDGDDQASIHLWLTVADKVVALARVCPAGTHMKEISIGRVITTERGKSYGKQIMLHAIEAAVKHFGATLIDIEAQEYAKGFYEGVGFKQSSDTFILDGIPHIKMTWKSPFKRRYMRKASRQMDATFALEVFDKAPYVTVSMTRPDGSPYGLPLSLARTDEKTFYFHCALEGDKLDCIAHNPTVFLSTVTKCAPTVGPKDGCFTLQFKSATAVGKAEIVTDREEKIAGLRAICQRFLPHHMDAFDEAIARSLERTAVVRITLTEPPVGKRKQYDKEGEELKN